MSLNSFLKKLITSKRKNYNRLAYAIENGNILGRNPLSLQIQTISSCNASCYFCPYPESWQKSHPGIINDNVYRKIIDETSKYKIGKFCPYLENEPFLDSKLFDRIEYGISKLNFNVLELATNSSTLTQKTLDNIIRIFPYVNNQIWVSFHGIDPYTFNSIMGLDFKTCKDNVLALVAKSQDNNINIRIRSSGMPRIKSNKMPKWFNKKQYCSFWKNEFKKHGFKKLPYLEFFTYHDRAAQIERNEVNYCKIIRPDLKGFYCERVDQWAHFLYTGEMILCCMDYKRETVFADITKKSLNEIYNSEEFIQLARQTTGKACSSDNFICKRCISPDG